MVRLTDSMIKKLSEPGLWFLRSDRQMNDFCCLLYELAVKMGVPVTVLSQNKKQIQNAVIAKVGQDIIKSAYTENEKNWLEDEMSEYHTHGFFFHPDEMNDYVPNGPFWSEYVSFREEDKLVLGNCPHKTVIVEDINALCYDDERVLPQILTLNNEEAVRNHYTVIVLLQAKKYGIATRFIDRHLLAG